LIPLKIKKAPGGNRTLEKKLAVSMIGLQKPWSLSAGFRSTIVPPVLSNFARLISFVSSNRIANLELCVFEGYKTLSLFGINMGLGVYTYKNTYKIYGFAWVHIRFLMSEIKPHHS
jgi:hypothetical protein